jgi:hypothetical protein
MPIIFIRALKATEEASLREKIRTSESTNLTGNLINPENLKTVQRARKGQKNPALAKAAKASWFASLAVGRDMSFPTVGIRRRLRPIIRRRIKNRANQKTRRARRINPFPSGPH